MQLKCIWTLKLQKMTKFAIKIYSIASVVNFTLLLLLLFTKIRKRWYAIKMYLDIEITTNDTICHKNIKHCICYYLYFVAAAAIH